MHFYKTNNIRTFKKIIRKYFDRSIRQGRYNRVFPWTSIPWVEYVASYDDIVASKEVRDLIGKDICDDFVNNIYKRRVYEYGKFGHVSAVVVTNEDNYWRCIDDDGNIICDHSCCGYPNFIPESVTRMCDELPDADTSFDVLEYSGRNDQPKWYYECLLRDIDGVMVWEDRSGIIHKIESNLFWMYTKEDENQTKEL